METRNFTQLHVGQHRVAKSLLSLLLMTLMAWIPATMFAEKTAKGLVCENGTLYLVYDEEEYTVNASTYEGSTVIFQTEIPSTGLASDTWFRWYPRNDIYEKITSINITESFHDFQPTSTSNLFSSLSKATTISGMEYLNTENVTNCSNMFSNCSNLTSITLPEGFGANVTDCSYMFNYCSKLTDINLPEGFGAKVTDCSHMFYYCSKLTDINLPEGFGAKVTDCGDMFYSGPTGTITIPNGFCLASITNYEDSPFYDCYASKIIVKAGAFCGETYNQLFVHGYTGKGYEFVIEDGAFPNATDFQSLFYGIDIEKDITIGKIGKEDAAKNMKQMFYEAEIRFENDENGIYFGDGFGKNADMSNMFFVRRCSGYGKIVFGNNACENATIREILYYAFGSLEGDRPRTCSFEFGDDFGLNANLSYMFGQTMLQRGNTITFGDNCGATNMSHMFGSFYNVYNEGYSIVGVLPVLKFGKNFGYNATDMSYMFSGLDDWNISWIPDNQKNSGIVEIEGLSNFNTSKVTDMSYMFACQHGANVRHLDLSNFDMSKVTNMHGMFMNMYSPYFYEYEPNTEDSKLTGRWDEFDKENEYIGLQTITWPKGLTNGEYTLEKVTDMGELFSGCKLLRHLTFGPWFTTSGLTTVESAKRMFLDCERLTYVDFYDCPDTELFPNNDNVKFWYDIIAGGASDFDSEHEHCYPFFGMSENTLVYLPKVQTTRIWTENFLRSVNYPGNIMDNGLYQHKIADYLYNLNRSIGSYALRPNLVYAYEDGTLNCDWFYHDEESYTANNRNRSKYDSEIPRGFTVRQQIDHQRVVSDNANRFGTIILPFEWSVPDVSESFIGNGLYNFQPFVLQSERDGTMFFKGVGSVSANTPFLFKWRQPSDNTDPKDGTGRESRFFFERKTNINEGIKVESTDPSNMKRVGGCTASKWDTQGFYEAQTLRYNSTEDYFYVPYKGSEEQYVNADIYKGLTTFPVYMTFLDEGLAQTSNQLVRIPRKNIYYISGGKFYRASKKNMVIDPHRVIFLGAWEKNSDQYYSKPSFSIVDDDPMATAIERFEQDCEMDDASAIYDTQGHCLQALQKGINIVRMKNGTVKKIIRR